MIRGRASRILLGVVLLAVLLTAGRPAAAHAAYVPAAAPYAVSDAGLTSALYGAVQTVPAAPAPQLPGLTFPAAWADAGAVETEAATAARVLPALSATGTLALGSAAFVTGVAIGLPIGLTIYRKLTANLGTPGTPGGWNLSWQYKTDLASRAAGANIPGVPTAGWLLCWDNGGCSYAFVSSTGSGGPGVTANAAALASATAAGATTYLSLNAPGNVNNGRMYVASDAQMSAHVAQSPSTLSEYGTLGHSPAYTAPNPMTTGDRSGARTALGAPVATRDGSGVYRDAAGNVLTAAQVQAQLDLNCRIDASYCAGAVNDPTADTLADRATVPSCAGLTFTACTAAFTAAGFTGAVTHTTLDFDHADLTKLADRVTTTSLSPGTFVPKTSPLTVTTNPADADMPRVLPAIDPGETSSHYRARLVALGLLAFFITEDTLDDATFDPRVGPEGAVRVWPRPLTRVHRGTGTDALPGSEYDPSTHPEGSTRITVVANPRSAPDATTTTDADPGPGGSGFTPPALPGIDLAPLSAIGAAGCATFPFGVPCWVLNTVHNLVGASEAPHFDWHIPAIATILPAGYTMHFDMRGSGLFGGLDALMQFVRPLLLLMSFVGIAMWLARKSSNNDATDAD